MTVFTYSGSSNKNSFISDISTKALGIIEQDSRSIRLSWLFRQWNRACRLLCEGCIYKTQAGPEDNYARAHQWRRKSDCFWAEMMSGLVSEFLECIYVFLVLIRTFIVNALRWISKQNRLHCRVGTGNPLAPSAPATTAQTRTVPIRTWVSLVPYEDGLDSLSLNQNIEEDLDYADVKTHPGFRLLGSLDLRKVAAVACGPELARRLHVIAYRVLPGGRGHPVSLVFTPW